MIHYLAPDFNPGAWNDYISKSSGGTDYLRRYLFGKRCGYTVAAAGRRPKKNICFE
jgi:hypothetical protein